MAGVFTDPKLLNSELQFYQFKDFDKTFIRGRIKENCRDSDRCSVFYPALLKRCDELKEFAANCGTINDLLFEYCADHGEVRMCKEYFTTTTTTTTGTNNLPFIIGGIVGAVVLLAIGIGIFIYCRKKKKAAGQGQSKTGTMTGTTVTGTNTGTNTGTTPTATTNTCARY